MYDLIVVGAGPAGLSAACHGKKNGLSVLVIEKGEIANTIFDYQKRKHVMSEPSMIPLRSDVPFQAGTRESLLEAWNTIAQQMALPIHRPEEVKDIGKFQDGFTVTTNKAEYRSHHVILAIGIQGNPRTLNVPGSTLPHVSTKLADPFIYENEDILMVGAGDAAIEGVLVLCEKNRVSVVNRNAEFYRLKDALNREVLEKVASGRVTAYHSAGIEKIEEGYAYVKLPDRTAKVKADLVFVRIGAEIPRPFLEKIGVTFASSNPGAPPILTKHYETTIAGLFLIGAVAGYNLIKQGMNQGYEVVERILGRDVEPVEEPILKERLKMLPGSIEDRFFSIQSTVPLLAHVSGQVLRELILESTVHAIKAGSVIFQENDYSDSFYSLLSGSVRVMFSARAAGDEPIILGKGEFFGEVGLLSGRRRSGTVTATEDSVLIETPRRSMLRLLSSEPSVKRIIDETFIVRALRSYLLPDADRVFLDELASKAETCGFKQGEVVFREGDVGDAFYLVRSGSMKVSKYSSAVQREVVVNHVPAGRYFGEIALLDPNSKRSATITATKYSEAIKLKKEDIDTILTRYPEFERQLRQNTQQLLIREKEVSLREVYGEDFINKMMGKGIMEGTDVLLIDENKCIRCDQCVYACANTHGGQTRLYRTEGIIFANLLVPTSCRHCENPLCLTDCLAGDAILRDPKGEVFIRENCIGCGNCAKNCPYGAIFMVHEEVHKELGPVERLLALIGLGKESKPEEGRTNAVKCDLCRDDSRGPACVRICPTGAAFRVSPQDYFKKVGVGEL